MNITIYVKFIDSMKDAKLDINDTNLIFEYPELYYLDLNLKYICDKDKGKAKFNNHKKELTIKLPVIGTTEESDKINNKNF